MQDNQQEIVQCNNCKAKVFTKVWNIHQIMCNRNSLTATKKPQTITKAKRKDSGVFSKFKEFMGFDEEEQQQQNEEAMIPCTQCGESFPFSAYAHHEQECIGHQLTLCQRCNIKFPTFLFEEHGQLCEGPQYNQNLQDIQIQDLNLSGSEDEEEESVEEENNLLRTLISTVAHNDQKSNNEQGLTQSQLATLKGPVFLKKIEDCPICCTEMRIKLRIIKLNCNHNYHGKCINSWLSKNPLCPMCRTHALKK